MSDVAPVAEGRRIKSLDVVRGWALLGILAVNAVYFSAPFQAAQNPLAAPIAVDQATMWAWFVVHVFFELKMITLFSMLFGASIFMIGGEPHDKARSAVLRRRLGWLAVFGLLHGALLWYGDILLHYAIAGLVVSLARSWRARTLAIAGVLLVAAQALVMVGLGAAAAGAPADALEQVQAAFWSPPLAEIERQLSAYQGGALSSLRENFEHWAEFTLSPFIVVYMVRTIGLMMIGMALFKWGFFSGRSPGWLYGLTAALGVLGVALTAWQAQINIARDFEFRHMFSLGQFANNALSPFVALLYASVLIVLVKAGALRAFTDALAAVGRMAFTNYLTQTLIMTTLFYGGRGLGLWGEVDRVGLWGIVVAVWLAQLIWSPLWLARFQMGPFEWLWRRLSYGRALAIAKA